MAKWLEENWGDVANVVGLVISIYAVWAAATARTYVRRVLERNRLLTLALDMREARTLCLWIADAEYNQHRCDHLRQLLAKHKNSDILSEREQSQFRESVGWFAITIHWDDRARRKVRDLASEIESIHGRVTEQLEAIHA